MRALPAHVPAVSAAAAQRWFI